MGNSLKFLIKFFIVVLASLFILIKVDPYSLPKPLIIPIRDIQVSIINLIIHVVPGSTSMPSTQAYDSAQTSGSIAWSPPINEKTQPNPNPTTVRSSPISSPQNSLKSNSDGSEKGVCIPNDPAHESPTTSHDISVTIAENQSHSLTANLPEWERMFKDRGVTATIHLHLYQSTGPNENTSRTYPPAYDNSIEMYIDLHAVNRGVMPGFPHQYLIGDGKTGADFGTAVSLHEAGHACLFSKGQIQKSYNEPLVEEYSHFWYGQYQLIVNQ